MPRLQKETQPGSPLLAGRLRGAERQVPLAGKPPPLGARPPPGGAGCWPGAAAAGPLGARAALPAAPRSPRCPGGGGGGGSCSALPRPPAPRSAACQPALPAADITARRRSDTGDANSRAEGGSPSRKPPCLFLSENPPKAAAWPLRRLAGGAAPVPPGAPPPPPHRSTAAEGPAVLPGGRLPALPRSGPGRTGPQAQARVESGAPRSQLGVAGQRRAGGWPLPPSPRAPRLLSACTSAAARGRKGGGRALSGASARPRLGERPCPRRRPPSPAPRAPLGGRRPRQCGGCPLCPPPAECDTGTEELSAAGAAPLPLRNSRRAKAARGRAGGAGQRRRGGTRSPGSAPAAGGEGPGPAAKRRLPGGGCPGRGEAARGRGGRAGVPDASAGAPGGRGLRYAGKPEPGAPGRRRGVVPHPQAGDQLRRGTRAGEHRPPRLASGRPPLSHRAGLSRAGPGTAHRGRAVGSAAYGPRGRGGGSRPGAAREALPRGAVAVGRLVAVRQGGSPAFAKAVRFTCRISDCKVRVWGRVWLFMNACVKTV
ncbi:uncharacterized protein LOC142603358 [Balearica regulorum gibbericeps]|uniref:uncharacterized protein LOC142603358 n=1 Tax=Balearica regulorum gibbericeps TaxID=100784 RepID=UPI003F626E75